MHLHPSKGGSPMVAVDEVTGVAGKGLVGDGRYYGRLSRRTGQPSRRQVTLIEREVLAAHAARLGCDAIGPGQARANVETEGIDLAGLVGRQLRVGTMLLEVVQHRDPCAKMDAVQPGLRALMEPPCQGVIAVVVESGEARVGDAVAACDLASAGSGDGLTS
ncbi:MAG: MOSC domain-containing protein [Verrucomicrobiota bacterium]